jgi:crotonobetainyl-CoA:carnitine CoA-transferase CaiB-like acyl-CoA transferase
LVGEHNQEVFGDVAGMSAEQINELRAKGII